MEIQEPETKLPVVPLPRRRINRWAGEELISPKPALRRQNAFNSSSLTRPAKTGPRDPTPWKTTPMPRKFQPETTEQTDIVPILEQSLRLAKRWSLLYGKRGIRNMTPQENQHALKDSSALATKLQKALALIQKRFPDPQQSVAQGAQALLEGEQQKSPASTVSMRTRSSSGDSSSGATVLMEWRRLNTRRQPVLPSQRQPCPGSLPILTPIPTTEPGWMQEPLPGRDIQTSTPRMANLANRFATTSHALDKVQGWQDPAKIQPHLLHVAEVLTKELERIMAEADQELKDMRQARWAANRS